MDWNKIATGAVGGAIDYGFGFLSSIFGNAAAARQAELNRQFQREERIASQEWNLEQWHRENEYNLPKNQLQRLLDAGINPNSAFNNLSTVSPGSVRSTPMSGATAGASPGPQSTIGQGLSKYWENKLLEKQANLTQSQDEGQQISNFWEPINQNNNNLDAKDRQNLAKKSYELLTKQVEQLGIQIEIDKLNLNFTPEQFQFQRDMFAQELALVGANVDNAKKQGTLIDEQIETEETKQGVNKATIGNIQEDTKSKKIANSVDEVKAYYFEKYGISCDDATASIYAKAVELKEQGKDAEAEKMLRDWFDNLADYRDSTQMPDLEKFSVDLLSPYKSQLGGLVGDRLGPIFDAFRGINPLTGRYFNPMPLSFPRQTSPYYGNPQPTYYVPRKK